MVLKPASIFIPVQLLWKKLEQDAQLVLDMVSGYQIDYPIAFDMEIYDEVNGRINSLNHWKEKNFFCS